MAIHPDGKIAVVGRTSNGTLDTTFNGSGKVVTPFGTGSDIPYSIAVQNEGRIVVAGTASSSIYGLVVYNPDGTLDSTFGSQGKVTTTGVSNEPKLALQSDGKIVLAGGSSDFLVIRYIGTLGPDTDGDGLPDIYETGTGTYVSPTNTGTNSNIADTDGDGLSDGEEVNGYGSNPHIRDTDGDGFDDGFEVSTGFSPTSGASTPDSLSSILTAVEYRFNAANGISYRIEASTDLANWITTETPIIGAGGVITRFYSIEGQPRRFFRSRRN